MSIKLFKHNEETYENMVEMFKTENRVGVVQPTGTGKSFLMLKWIEEHPEDEFIILAPSTEIFTQLQEYVADSEMDDILSHIRMIAYQELIRMKCDEIKDLSADKIILDEFHRTGAEQWGPAVDILLKANPKAKILGLSATPIRYLDNAKDMALELFDRNLAREMTLGEAVAKGILPEPIYVPVWYDTDKKIEKYQKDIQTLKNEKERAELEKELEKAKRHLEKAYGPDEIFKKYMLNDHGKFIVFCSGKEHLNIMIPVVKKWLEKVNRNTRIYISTSDEPDKEKQLQAFRKDNTENSIKLLFTIDRLNEGIHVKGIDGVIMLRTTISPIIYLQQIGRALSNGGKFPIIFDMVNNYANVQIPLVETSSFTHRKINVFEKEFIESTESEEKKKNFKIFEEMITFNQIVEKIEYILYPNNDEIWFKWFYLYIEFKAKYSREPLESDVYVGMNLGLWCGNQRRLRNNGKLALEREKLLHKAGFDFASREDRLDQQWHCTLALYVEFKDRYGREPGKREMYGDLNLGRWCCTQRQIFKNGTLSLERINLLQEAGFDFDPLETQWYNNLNSYVEFKTRFGREPKYDEMYRDVNLGRWCGTQRREYNRGKLIPERIEILQEAGFDFDPLETQWYRALNLYIEFKTRFGREPLDGEVYNDFNINWWCKRIRRDYKKGSLDSKYLELLLAAEFDFEPYETQWHNILKLYIEFRTKFGEEPKYSEIYEDTKLGVWCSNQRHLYKNGKLKRNREKLLLEAGFIFDITK